MAEERAINILMEERDSYKRQRDELLKAVREHQKVWSKFYRARDLYEAAKRIEAEDA